MTSTLTTNRTFTITNARYVASKIAADLDLLRAYHGRPSEQEITDYAVEIAMLLAARYLASMEYGFSRNGVSILALKYIARSDGTLIVDDRPGRVYAEINTVDASWYSYRIYDDNFWKLDAAARARFEAELPVQRVDAPEPRAGNGYWEQNRTYSSNGEGVMRHVFRAL